MTAERARELRERSGQVGRDRRGIDLQKLKERVSTGYSALQLCSTSL